MRIKLDENMPFSLAALLRSAGHNVSTVPEENLSGWITRGCCGFSPPRSTVGRFEGTG